jgi:hypothetical protein
MTDDHHPTVCQPRQGAAAVSALKAKKFQASDVDCIAGGDGAAAALSAAGVYQAAAETYAEKLKDGGAVVVVPRALRNALLAKRVLDEAGPELRRSSTTRSTSHRKTSRSARRSGISPNSFPMALSSCPTCSSPPDHQG